MMSVWWLLLIPVLMAASVVVTLIVVAKDDSLIRIRPDEILVKKPEEGLILVALTKEMARRVIMKKENSSGQIEARDLYLQNNQ